MYLFLLGIILVISPEALYQEKYNGLIANSDFSDNILMEIN